MKNLVSDVLYAVNLGMVLPTLLAVVMMWGWQTDTDTVPVFEQVQETAEQTQAVFMVPVQKEDGSVQKMDMDSYLLGVVLAEMPADFESEALKAQAVAARTFSRKICQSGGKHTDGSVCMDSHCCQAYSTTTEFLRRGGTPELLDKVRNAVADTSGMVLMYDGELIEATYYSCSGGRSENAAAVWGTEYPYLVAVDSPGEESAAHYEDKYTLSLEEFREKLKLDENETEIGKVVLTSGGGVDTMEINGKTYSGTELRQKLELGSTAMEMKILKNSVEICTRGYGHRVGLSQYGADAMAVAGSSCEEILEHYYPGAKLVKINVED